MENKRKNRLAVALGVVAGAAAGWWLNSDRGRKFRKDTAEKAVEVGNQVGDTAREQISNVSENLKNLAGQGKETIAKAGDAIKNGISNLASSASDQVDSGENALKNGADKAKNKLNQIEQVLNQ